MDVGYSPVTNTMTTERIQMTTDLLKRLEIKSERDTHYREIFEADHVLGRIWNGVGIGTATLGAGISGYACYRRAVAFGMGFKFVAIPAVVGALIYRFFPESLAKTIAIQIAKKTSTAYQKAWEWNERTKIASETLQQAYKTKVDFICRIANGDTTFTDSKQPTLAPSYIQQLEQEYDEGELDTAKKAGLPPNYYTVHQQLSQAAGPLANLGVAKLKGESFGLVRKVRSQACRLLHGCVIKQDLYVNISQPEGRFKASPWEKTK